MHLHILVDSCWRSLRSHSSHRQTIRESTISSKNSEIFTGAVVCC
ncbi:unnamed protein product [Strongylus vulgaris]|uniref:Uncharacterized protein n=1 Tax=Strongylus vulgaris TaxID=40348 RepID=A0A3P7JJW7_STRVU|nr:unnamed protein product [Strongylus vulgaris]